MAEEIKSIPIRVSRRTNLFAYIDIIGEIVEKYKLNNDQEKKLVLFGRSVILKEIPISSLFEKIKQELGLEEQKTNELVTDFIGLQLLPLQDYLGDVTGEIRKLGGNLDKYLERADQILKPEKLLWDNIAQVWGQADYNIDEVSEEQRKNHFNIISNLIQQKIQPIVLADLISLPLVQGGLGVDREKSEILADWTENIVVSGDISLKDFQELDQIRKKVLGDKFTSILEVNAMNILIQPDNKAEELKSQFQKFLAQPEVRQVLEEVEKFEKLTRLRQGSGRTGKLEIE